MRIKTSVVSSLSAAGLMLGAMGSAHALEFGNHAWGPIEINGYVTVDNTGQGGVNEDFACKVVGYGRIDPWFDNNYQGFPPSSTNILWIEGIQARHRSSGDAPAGCNMVRFFNLPWSVTFTGTDPEAPSVVMGNIGILAPQSVGCGDTPASQMTPPGSFAGPGGIAWAQEGGDHVPPLPLSQGDAVYSTLSFTNVAIPSTVGDCVMNGIIKITRPHAPYLID